MKVLFVNHGLSKHCGVYTQGLRHFDILARENKNIFFYFECNSYIDLEQKYSEILPDIILYNYMPIVMPWLDNRIKKLSTRHVCIIHNITQDLIDNQKYRYDNIFDYYITLDMSLNVDNKFIFKTDRPVYEFLNKNISFEYESNKVIKIGSFGFPFMHKGFQKIANLINQEFNHATFNLHMTDSYFCVNETEKILNLCKNSINKNGININYTNDYLSEIDLIARLNENDVNILLYDNINGVGVSAAIDYLISAQKPIIISQSQQFRNFFDRLPIYPYKTIKDIILNYQDNHYNVCEIYNDCLFNVPKRTMEILNAIK